MPIYLLPIRGSGIGISGNTMTIVIARVGWRPIDGGGGPDEPINMQWQTKAAAKAKDTVE
jgi:hypothetical protein